ncbi:MAG: hypothetical protein FGM16_03870 [Flavobacterium sp.]|nr:hypothetical protein [Flavobacterium sp.]
MKYARLTKEQFEELHPEFIRFLATQSIDKAEWDSIKSTKPEVADQELDVFSDLIWEGVLSRATHLEYFSKNHVFLFHCKEQQIETIVLKSLDASIDFLTNEGLHWLSDHLFTKQLSMQQGVKKYAERNSDLFALIQQGAILSDGKLYDQIHSIIMS